MMVLGIAQRAHHFGDPARPSCCGHVKGEIFDRHKIPKNQRNPLLIWNFARFVLIPLIIPARMAETIATRSTPSVWRGRCSLDMQSRVG
jgi:hypothetical protein